PCLRFEVFRGAREARKPGAAETQQHELLMFHQVFENEQAWQDFQTNSQAWKDYQTALGRQDFKQIIVQEENNGDSFFEGSDFFLYRSTAAFARDEVKQWQTKVRDSEVVSDTGVLEFQIAVLDHQQPYAGTEQDDRLIALKAAAASCVEARVKMEDLHVPALQEACADSAGCLYFDAFRNYVETTTPAASPSAGRAAAPVVSLSSTPKSQSLQNYTYSLQFAFQDALARTTFQSAIAFTSYQKFVDETFAALPTCLKFPADGPTLGKIDPVPRREFGILNLPTLFSVTNKLQFKPDADYDKLSAAIEDLTKNLFPAVRKACEKEVPPFPRGAESLLCERYNVFERQVDVVSTGEGKSTTSSPIKAVQFLTQELYPDRYAYTQLMLQDDALKQLQAAVARYKADGLVEEESISKTADQSNLLALQAGDFARLNGQTDADLRSQSPPVGGLQTARALFDKTTAQDVDPNAATWGKVETLRFTDDAVENRADDVAAAVKE
ncbi:unnamed protein product, partial [Amoebophrya sp. A120]